MKPYKMCNQERQLLRTSGTATHHTNKYGDKKNLSKSLVKQPTTSFPTGPLWREMPFPVPASTHPLIKTKSHLFLKVSSKVAPLHVPQRGPYGEMFSPEPSIHPPFHAPNKTCTVVLYDFNLCYHQINCTELLHK